MQLSCVYTSYMYISFFIFYACVYFLRKDDRRLDESVISMVAENHDYRIFRRTIFLFSHPFFESLRNTRCAVKKVHSREFANLNRLIYWMRINFGEAWQAKLNDVT